MTIRDASVIIGEVEKRLVLKQKAKTVAMTVAMILLETTMTKAKMTTTTRARMTVKILMMISLFLKSLTLLWNSS